MKKLVVICGPTATGKTSLGVLLAKQFDGEIISADARQIYTGLDIGTGKEVSLLKSGQAKKLSSKWIIDDVPVHLYDIADPKDVYSAADFGVAARAVIEQIWQNGKLPILVGGSGFYLQAVIEGIGSSGIKSDPALRRRLESLSLKELQDELLSSAPKIFNQLNNSDKNNPRRLQRKVELAASESHPSPSDGISKPLNADILWIGLTDNKKDLDLKISNRIKQMFSEGLAAEVQITLSDGYSFEDPGLQSIGYSEFKDFISGTSTLTTVQNQIILHTTQYAKRQITWFKRNKAIHWFTIGDLNYKEKIEKTIKSWYYSRT